MVKIYLSIDTEDKELLEEYNHFMMMLKDLDGIDEACISTMEGMQMIPETRRKIEFFIPGLRVPFLGMKVGIPITPDLGVDFSVSDAPIRRVRSFVKSLLPGQKASVALGNIYTVELVKDKGISELTYYLQSKLLPKFEGKASIKLRVEDLRIEFTKPYKAQLILLTKWLTRRMNVSGKQ